MAQDNMLAHRGERVLAFMVASAIGLSLICFLAVFIGSAAGVGENDGFSSGVWPVVLVLPVLGLPLGMALLIALIIVSGIRRSRDARDASR